MEKSLKKRQSSLSRSKFRSLQFTKLMQPTAVLLCGAAVCFWGLRAHAATAKPPQKPSTETYQDLIEKAQNLSLQKDRLQASQILTRAIAKESKGSVASKALTLALSDLMTTFYTERAQSAFAAAESNLPAKPREAIEGFTEALRLEEGNVTILKALARTHLSLAECAPADGFVTKAENLDPYGPEILLLRLQVIDCEKQDDILATKLFPLDPSLTGFENVTRGLQVKDLVRRTETKKAKALVAQWETADPAYPEVYFWKWTLSKDEKPDRPAARKYVELCQNLTPRKRKSFNLDVDLCKGKEAVDAFLKEPSHDD